ERQRPRADQESALRQQSTGRGQGEEGVRRDLQMIYDLLLAGPTVAPSALADALTAAVGAGRVDVDIADRDDDQEQRDWSAPVLCGYIRLRGYVSMSLDIYVVDELLDTALSEADFALRLAAA